jgi:hypothetical protein
MLQSFEEVYSLKEWIDYYYSKVKENKLEVDTWLEYLVTIFNQSKSDDDRKAALRAIFLPTTMPVSNEKIIEFEKYYSNLNGIILKSASSYSFKN